MALSIFPGGCEPDMPNRIGLLLFSFGTGIPSYLSSSAKGGTTAVVPPFGMLKLLPSTASILDHRTRQ